MSLLYLAVFCFAGFCLARAVIPGRLRASVHNALLVSLGAGLGLAIASALYFLCLAVAGPKIEVLAVVESAFVAGAVVLGLKATATRDDERHSFLHVRFRELIKNIKNLIAKNTSKVTKL